VAGQGAVRFGALALRDFELVAETDGGEAKELVVAFDAALNIGFQIVCSWDSARFQRAGKCAGQSTGERGDDVVNGSGKRRGVFNAVIFGVATVDAKMKRLGEALDVRIATRPFLLDQTDFCGMNQFTHECLPPQKMPQKRNSYRRGCGLLFIVLNERKRIDAV
jgi:hypothetical protein